MHLEYDDDSGWGKRIGGKRSVVGDVDGAGVDGDGGDVVADGDEASLLLLLIFWFQYLLILLFFFFFVVFVVVFMLLLSAPQGHSVLAICN